MYDIFDNAAFASKFSELEVKHPQVLYSFIHFFSFNNNLYSNYFEKRTQFKMGVMYVKEGQLHPKEWFSNGQGRILLLTFFG